MKDLLGFLHMAQKLMKPENTYWFRGHANEDHQLIPSVFRPRHDGSYYNEAQLLKEFVRMNPDAREKHSNTFELLTYAQHYGLPTRLLDWTTNLLVAIYFACKYDKSTEHKDAKVYIYDIEDDLHKAYLYEKTYQDFVSLDTTHGFYEYFFEKLFLLSQEEQFKLFINDTPITSIKPPISYEQFLDDVPLKIREQWSDNGPDIDVSFLLDITVPYQPTMINERVKRQHGCFTIHGGKIINGKKLTNIYPFGSEDMAFTRIKPKRVQFFRIAHQFKPQVLKQLEMFGISESTLFPELEYQTAAIAKRCFDGPYSDITNLN